MQNLSLSRLFNRDTIIAAILYSISICLPLYVAHAAAAPAAQVEQVAAQVSLNSATAEELSAALSGVGMKKAEAIVAFRNQYGPFKNIDEIVEVKGIGEATFQKNKDKLAL